MEEVETAKKDLEHVSVSTDVLDAITNGIEHKEKPALISNPSSPNISRMSEKEQSEDFPKDEHEKSPEQTSTEARAVAEAESNNDTRQELSRTSEPIKGLGFSSTIPKPKKTQKRTLNELHEQLLRKLDPNLIPSVSTSLSEIFKISADNRDNIDNRDIGCSKEQEKEKEKGTISVNCGDSKIPRETSNGVVKNLTNGPDSQPVEKGLYRCYVADCKCSFNRVNDLKTHVNAEHPDLKSYPCSFCFNEFEELDLMTEHLKTHIKNVFKCSNCQMPSDTKEELLGHISSEHPGLPKKITIYVKILNNDRQKRAANVAEARAANGELNQIPSSSSDASRKTVIADETRKDDMVSNAEPSTVDTDSSNKSSNIEVTKSRSSRKSLKPVKWQKDPTDDVICIFSAEKMTTIPCDRCSFTCDSQLHLKNHQLEGHINQNVSRLFRCKICRFSTDVKLSFQNHMIHHKGRNVIRYYICPYCVFDTSSMDVVEEHILDKHPSDAFRFEVLQETMEFLTDLLKCPVCSGAFLWKEEFIDHIRSFHCLQELADHLVENFSDAFPANSLVPKSLFRNLLPESTEFEELSVEQMVVSSDEENSGTAIEDQKKDVKSLNEETSVCVQQSSTKEKVFQFNCHTCNYTSCDYDEYMAHFKNHDSEKSESLIKKLLTKSVVPPYTSGLSSDLELDLDVFQTSSSDALFASQKTRGTFRCHLCPFTCTKTVHFKRHLAIHARNETLKEGYKCGYCQFAHYRLNCVKFHLGKYHGNFPNKMIRIMDGVEIELGAEDDPGKVRRSVLPSGSAPSLRTASEKRPTVRYENSEMPKLQRSSALTSHDNSGAGISSREMSLTEFELQLPAQMIYPEAVKCPKCDFTNRVRINLVRHLKLHREEAEMNDESPYSSPSSTFLKESSELRAALVMDDSSRSLIQNTNKHEAPSASTSSTSKRNLILDEKPLLRSILCEKPVAPRLEREDVEGDNSNGESNPEDPDLEVRSRPKTLTDHSDYSVRLHGSDLYQCKECAFVHRFPSKVKRHFNCKHIGTFPYKCGYCSFKAAESGRVRRHCHQVHRSQPARVIRSDSSAAKKNNIVTEEIDDDVVIVDEIISGNVFEGRGDRWLSQFVIKVDSNIQCCKLCGYQEERPMSLQRHVYTKHLKLYPFSCKYCGMALTEIDRVKRHIEKYHPGMPLVVVRRHFEDLPPDGSFREMSENEKISCKISVKNEPLEIDEEAPQLDFYPKSDDFVTSLASADWNDEDNGDSNDESEKILSCFPKSSVNDCDNTETDDFESFEPGNLRRLFKCAYCGIISKWNRRDIRLHVMHVHLKRRVYTCRHCSFGNSKSKAVVKSHCAKFHPNRPVSVRDDLALFNAIIPIEDKNGVVTMAFSDSSGAPLLDIDELENSESKKMSSTSELKKPSDVQPIKTEVNESETSAGGETISKHFASTRRMKNGEIPLDLSSRKPQSTVNLQEKTAGSSRVAPGTSKSEPVIRQCTEWRCKLCSFVSRNASHVKCHLICHHLKLKPFSCPYCRLYIWKSQGVFNHIEKLHPGQEKKLHSTIEEKAAYISANIEKVIRGSSAAKEECLVEQKSVQEDTSTNDGALLKNGFFRCGICGYQDTRNDKTKYHIIKQHLRLRQFSCPHCHLYMWGRQQVVKHIEEEHPGMEISITRTFQEYDDFLKQTITKVAGKTPEASEAEVDPDASSDFEQTPASSSPLPSLLQLRCNLCSFVTDSEMSLSAHKRSHRMFQCFHCEFRHTLAAKVQIHCLAKHPNKLVKYKRCDAWSDDLLGDRLSSLNVRQKPTSEKKEVKVFHPCDECPEHFDTASELEQHVSSEHGEGMYVCNYCHIVMWTQAAINEHLQKIHPEKQSNFKFVKKDPNSRKRKHSSDSSEEVDFSARKVQNREISNDHDFPLLHKESSIVSDQLQHDSTNDTLSAYGCRLCNYRSNKVTVMRHHTMSHLRYHPYLCPYCDVMRSVKSFPVTKHVRSKHPGCELKFLYARDEALETQVKNSYYRIHSQSKNSSAHEEIPSAIAGDEIGENVSEIATGSPTESEMISTSSRKILYKCTFCGLKTHVRTDMRHHLMREIQYKPFHCMYCTYTEPCKWSMRKHFRIKHGGIEVEVEEMRDPDSDARIEKLLEKCTVFLKPTTDPKILTRRPSATPQRRNLSIADARSKPKVTSNSASHSKSMLGASLLKRPFKSTKSMAIKFHRCPHCAYTNTSLKLVRGHMVRHGPFRLQCGYCDYRGHYPSRIQKHLRRHHPSMPFKCTKVSLPPKDEKAEEIAVIHVPQVAVKTQNKPAPGTVYLDGVPVDIPLIPDSEGWYRCLQCDYQSVNREHFKMHAVIHRPPKWKCFYCDQKYPVIFRLRRHSNSKHPNLPIKWIDVETGQINVGSLKSNAAAKKISHRNHEKPRSTARKSTSRAHLRVALFRSHQKSFPSVGSSAPSSDSDLTVVDETPFVIGKPYSLLQNDSESEAESSIDIESSGVINLCCHLCSFSTVDRVDFIRHVAAWHANLYDTVTIEILSGVKDCDAFALRRCGFCQYETYAGQEFSAHVRSHTTDVPVQCNYCTFASFSSKTVKNHIEHEHPGLEVRLRLLKDQYTMSNDMSIQQQSIHGLDAIIMLQDFMKLSDLEFQSLISSNDVSFNRPLWDCVL